MKFVILIKQQTNRQLDAKETEYALPQMETDYLQYVKFYMTGIWVKKLTRARGSWARLRDRVAAGNVPENCKTGGKDESFDHVITVTA